jgi:hypothetical protein
MCSKGEEKKLFLKLNQMKELMLIISKALSGSKHKKEI